MSTQEQPEAPLYDFMYAKFLVKDLFDVVLGEDDYIERAYNIYRQIGNVYAHLHLYEFTVPESKEMELPCNVFSVEAVTYNSAYLEQIDTTFIYHDHVYNDNYRLYVADALNKSIKNITPQRMTGHAHALGQFVPYELVGKKLLFDEKWIGAKLYLLYKGAVVDDSGNPCLYRKEAEAIAYKLAYLDAQKRAFKGDPGGVQAVNLLKFDVGRLIQAAKIPDTMTQNFLDRMLSTKTRHDRKVFYNSYKLQ